MGLKETQYGRRLEGKWAKREEASSEVQPDSPGRASLAGEELESLLAS